MRAEIICVGTELLLGDIVNTNAQYLARELATLGFTVYYQSVVGDNPMRLKSLVHQAKERSEVLVFTGGLGPTDDDLTKETVAETFGDSLVSDPEEIAKLELYAKKVGRPLAPNNRKQAMVPRRGQKLVNPHGSAPGVMFRQGGKFAFLLPGPPREMKPMFENEVKPILEALQDGAIRSCTLHVVGIGESDLEMKLKDFVGGTNPTVALYAKEGEVHVRITSKAQTEQQADYMSQEMAILVKKVIGDVVYSQDDKSLPETVVHLLMSQGESVALAESCTGGLLAQRLTSAPGASAVFGYGAVSYANEFKHQMLGVRKRTLARFGAVSSQVCAEMAFGAAKKGIAEYGVGITGIAGPDGGSEEKPVGLVYVGVCKGAQVWIRKLNVPSRSRDVVRHIATQNALDMLRRLALGLEMPKTKIFAENQIADFEREGRAQWRGASIVRILVATALAVVFLGAVLLATYFSGQTGEEAAALLLPTAQGLHYGSDEYTDAAQKLVSDMQRQSPTVSGFVALPNGLVESFVAESQQEQDTLSKALQQPATEGMAVFGKNATLKEQGENILLMGGGSLRPIMDLAETENISQVSSFTYFTEDEALEYLVFAVAYFEDDAIQEDGFDPSLLSLNTYNDFMQFVLGAKGRSLYTIPLEISETDTFMTLQTEDPDTPGQSVYLFGRLRRPAEEDPAVQTAGQPLMPQAFYEESGYPYPDMQATYNRWLQEFLARGTGNMELQIQQGMPSEDIAPTVVLYPQETQAIEAEEEAEEEGEVQAEEEAAQDESAVRAAPSETPVSVKEALAVNEREVTDKTTLAVSSNVSASENVPSSSTGTSATQSSSDVASGQSSSVAVASEVVAPLEEPSEPQPVIQRPDPRFLVVRMNGVLVRDTVENVLAAICQYEIADAPPEAIKAQAIAIHSWVLNQQGADNPAPAVRGEAPSLEVRALVEEVSNLVISEDGYNPAFTPWFQSAASGTNSSQDLFGVERSYLQGVSTNNERGQSEVQQTVEVSEEEMRGMLSAWPGLEADNLGEADTWFSELVRNDSGYAVSLSLAEVSLSGLELWQKVLQKNAEPILQSPAFDVSFNGDVFRFTVYGEGHGCGLSQEGAAEFALQDGMNSEEILAHYFPETELIEWV